MNVFECLDGNRVKEEVLHNAEEAYNSHYRQVTLTV